MGIFGLGPEQDFCILRKKMIRYLRNNPGFKTFTTVAANIGLPADLVGVLASLAEADKQERDRPNVFVVSNNGSAVTLGERGHAIAQEMAQQLTSLIGEACEATATYAGQLRPYCLDVSCVDRGRPVMDRYLHELTVDVADDDLRLSDDTPVTLKPEGGAPILGRVAGLSRDEAVVYVAFDRQILGVDLPAKLIVDRKWQWSNAAAWLESQAAVPPLFQQIRSAGAGCSISSADSREVGRALADLATPWARLLWGPPGSGKTFCVAELVAARLQRNPTARILVAAPSNVAVDTATLEILAALERQEQTRRLVQDRKILRYGYPKNPDVLIRTELFGSVEIESLSRAVQAVHRELRGLREAGAEPAAIAEKTAAIQQLQEQRRRAMGAHIARASVVTTTVAAIMSGQGEFLSADPWDTVIVDEASMIGGSMLLLLASRANQRFLCSGDPRQLGPICEWSLGEPPGTVQRWIAQDPFEFAGLSHGEGLQRQVNTENPRIARILCQRRCRPEIWKLVSMLYPAVAVRANGILLLDEGNEDWALKNPVTVLDVGSGTLAGQASLPAQVSEDRLAATYESACRQVGRSWQNPPTAMLAIEAARELRARNPKASVAIITPYRAQVRLIRRWLHEEVKSDPRRWLEGVEVGTVHAFQGGEADFVIFDLVDGAPRPSGLGKILRGDSGVRLVNVAVTRARAKLVVIAHRAWFQNTGGDLGLLRRVLRLDAPETVVRIRPLQGQRAPKAAGQVMPESPIEAILLEAFHRRQPPVPPFVLQHRICDRDGTIVSRADFAFVPQRVAVYCDGARYHLQQGQWQKDLRQRRRLATLNWCPIAFSGAEIKADPDRCVREILTLVGERSAAEAVDVAGM